MPQIGAEALRQHRHVIGVIIHRSLGGVGYSVRVGMRVLVRLAGVGLGPRRLRGYAASLDAILSEHKAGAVGVPVEGRRRVQDGGVLGPDLLIEVENGRELGQGGLVVTVEAMV